MGREVVSPGEESVQCVYYVGSAQVEGRGVWREHRWRVVGVQSGGERVWRKHEWRVMGSA